tara:strand:- start:19 stop:324 length:306 start_codon:yes stop_codon:yes gene_type:complete
MPELANIKVGSFCGTSALDSTISWSRAAKKDKNDDRISETDVMESSCLQGLFNCIGQLGKIKYADLLMITYPVLRKTARACPDLPACPAIHTGWHVCLLFI